MDSAPVIATVILPSRQPSFVTNLKAVVDRISEMPSYNWSLSMLCSLNGLQLVLEWNENKTEYEFPGVNWITMFYPNPASWAHADLSQMWQYVPDDRETKVYSNHSYESNISFVGGFSLNVEGREKGWSLDRIIACDDVIDVISQSRPTIKLHESPPPIMDWWNSGWNAIGKQG